MFVISLMKTFLSPDLLVPTPSFNIEVFLLFGGGSLGEFVVSGDTRCWTLLGIKAVLSLAVSFVFETSVSTFVFFLYGGMLGKPPFLRFVIALRAILACRLGRIGLSDGCLSTLAVSFN